VLKIYIVEDSPIILRLLSSTVASAGAKLAGSSDSAPEAIAELFSWRPQLILIDLALRVGSGFDVLAALQPGYIPSPAKVVFTNHALPEYRQRGLQLGATHFFDKSTEGKRLIELVHLMAADLSGHDVAVGSVAGLQPADDVAHIVDG
jgi:CheY-like chemotaxis protein